MSFYYSSMKVRVIALTSSVKICLFHSKIHSALNKRIFHTNFLY